MSDQSLIESELQKLIGTCFFDPHRAANMATFQFKGVQGIEYSLHIQCPWRLSNANSIITASWDMYEPADIPDSTFDWKAWYGGERCWEEGKNLYDRRMRELIENTTDEDRTVIQVSVNSFGDFTITFNNKVCLTAFINGSSDVEMWRFFEQGNKKRHLVVTAQGMDHDQPGLD